MLEPGDVVLVRVPFTDTFEVKLRPAVVLYEAFGNVVVAGITSNTAMRGIPLLRTEGAIKDSAIKTNYLFTIAAVMVGKRLFSLSAEKRKTLHAELMQQLSGLLPPQ